MIVALMESERTVERMTDLISRQAAIDAIKRAEALVRAFGYHNAVEAIREVPTIEAEPTYEQIVDYCKERDLTLIPKDTLRKLQAEPKHGRWIYLYAGGYKCSSCGAWWTFDETPFECGMDYCPSCGADMREVKRND